MRIVTSECLLYWTLDPGYACVDHFSSISKYERLTEKSMV